MKKLVILILSLSLLAIACNKEEVAILPVPPIEDIDFNSCHFDEDWDEDSIKQALIGQWRWHTTFHPWTNEYESSSEGDLEVHFVDATTVNIVRNNAIESTLTWDLEEVDNEVYRIVTTPFEYTIVGNFYFCDDLLAFVNSYLDGDDLFYQQIAD